MRSLLDSIPDKRLAGLFARDDAPVSTLAAHWGEIAATAAIGATIRLEHSAVLDEPSVKARRVGRAGIADLDYEVGALIGEGGGGRVFEARQVSANRTVALKRLLPEWADIPARRVRFLREALLAAEFDHPHLLAVHDIGVDQNGQPFFIMPRVEGVPWSRTIRERSLPDNLAVLAKLADAVAHLHARGVVHRDLKPANVLLGPHGEVLLTDWGLAIRLPDPGKGRGLPPGAESGGTPAYMAPEMARDDRTLIGFASDVYLLGAILYEVLTGAPPHSGKDVAQTLLNATNRPCSPESLPGKAGDLARLALSTDPARRPKADEFATVARLAIHSRKKQFRLFAAACFVIAIGGYIIWRMSTIDISATSQPPEIVTTNGAVGLVTTEQSAPLPGAVMSGLTPEEVEQLSESLKPPSP